MSALLLVLVAAVSVACGAALGWIVARRRPGTPAAAQAERWSRVTDAVPFSAPIEDLATALRNALDERTDLGLLAVYAGKEDDEALTVYWREDGGQRDRLPAAAPATLVLQLAGPTLVDLAELGKGLRPGLPPADAAAEASQLEAERIEDEKRAAESMFENPFELEDEALTHSVIPPPLVATGVPGAGSAVDAATLAARLIAVPWTGPFGWRGVIVAQPGPDPLRHAGDAGLVAAAVGPRLGLHCELERSARTAANAGDAAAGPEAAPSAPEPAPEPAAPSPPSPAGPPPVAARLHRAEVRMADALQSPRREADLLRNAVGLLAEGLATDRCYVVEVEGLHTKPVTQERRSEAVASAIGLDFGGPFIAAVRARSASTIKAIASSARNSGDLLPEEVNARLGPMSRLLVPVTEKGHTSAIYVCEWIDQAKRLSDDDVTFAERVVARAAVAVERLHQVDALAQQAAHAREAQEQVEEAFAQIQALVAALPEAVIGLDTDGHITFANRAAGKYFRRQEFELIGRSVTDVVGGTGGDAVVWERAMGASGIERYASTHATPDGPSTYDVTVVTGLQTAICDRLVTLTLRSPSSEG